MCHKSKFQELANMCATEAKNNYTQYSRLPLEKLPVAQLVKKFMDLYRIQSYIITFTSIIIIGPHAEPDAYSNMNLF